MNHKGWCKACDDQPRLIGGPYCEPCEDKLRELGWDKTLDGEGLIVQNRDNYSENLKETSLSPKKPKKPSTPKSNKTKKGKK